MIQEQIGTLLRTVVDVVSFEEPEQAISLSRPVVSRERKDVSMDLLTIPGINHLAGEINHVPYRHGIGVARLDGQGRDSFEDTWKQEEQLLLKHRHPTPWEGTQLSSSFPFAIYFSTLFSCLDFYVHHSLT